MRGGTLDGTLLKISSFPKLWGAYLKTGCQNWPQFFQGEDFPEIERSSHFGVYFGRKRGFLESRTRVQEVIYLGLPP